MVSGFTWTAGLAHYQGFWQDEDLKDPITMQQLLFDGKDFIFSGYQLNTLGRYSTFGEGIFSTFFCIFKLNKKRKKIFFYQTFSGQN